jgi:hypothetical protein
MRGKIKLVSFVLCAVFMFGFAALTANAQVVYSVSSNPNEVVHYGVTEVMGRFRLEATNTGPSVGSTITITYQGVSIKNASGVATPVGDSAIAGSGQAVGGIQVQGSGVFAGPVVGFTFTSVATTGTGGQVIVSIPAGIIPLGTPNTDTITIDGVRADVSAKSVGTDVIASISSSPSTANTFSNTSVLRVATVNESLVITVNAVSDPICLPPLDPTIHVTEGASGVMVQYVASAAGTAFPVDRRDLFGAVNNTRVNIVLSPLPTGTTLAWPTTVQTDPDGAGAPFSYLELITQSTSGDAAYYEFVTGSQAESDNYPESFAITPVVSIDPDIAVPGTSTAQAQLYPPNPTAATAVPRFAHPLLNNPADLFISVSKCTTNLLFPFLTNSVGSGADSGFAILNTSSDPYGTVPQEGTITHYFYGIAAPASITSPSVAAGQHFAAVISQIAPGFQGYMIAICEFQYGHGFAFITLKYNAGSVFDVAEGYVANVIPDPGFNGGVRFPSVPQSGQASGENLGN